MVRARLSTTSTCDRQATASRAPSGPPHFDRHGLWALVDQGVVSASNFGCTILVARFAGKEELGLFCLAFLVFVMLSGLVKALIWTPATSFIPQLSESERCFYNASVTVHLAMVCTLASAALLVLAAIFARLRPGDSFDMLFCMLAPYATAMLLREHVRKLCLARLQIGEALLFDVCVACTQLAALIIAIRIGNLSAVTAMAAMAVGGVVVVAWLTWRRSCFRWSVRLTWAHWRKNWAIAKWITPNAAMVQIGNQTPRWMLEAFYGLREVGAFFSAQNVIQFVNPFVLGSSNYFGPRSARLYADQGAHGLWRCTLENTRLLFVLMMAVVASAALVGPWIIRLAYGAEFVVNRALIVSIALGVLSEALLMPIEFALLTLGKAPTTFVANCARLLINLTLGLLLVYVWGGHGIGYGLSLGNTTALVWMWLVFAVEVQRPAAPTGGAVLHQGWGAS